MKCPRCKRSLAAKKKTCIYCGALLNDRFSNHKTRIAINDNNSIIFNNEHTKVDLKGLKETDWREVKDAIGKDENGIVLKQQTQIRTDTSTQQIDKKLALPFEKILTVLDKIKKSHNDGHIEYAYYKQMVVDIVKDYLATLDENVKIHFIVNEIQDSELSDYLDDEILRDLTAFVISPKSDK